MVAINLVPDAIQQRRHDARIKHLAVLSLSGWLALLVVVVVVCYGYAGIRSLQLQSLKNQQASLNSTVNSADNVKFRQEALEVQTSLTALDQLFNRQQRISAIDNRLAALTPHEVTLLSVTVDDTKTVNISGVADSYNDVGKMIAALKTSKTNDSKQIYFNGIDFAGANVASGGKVDFSVKASYVYPTDVSEVNQ